MEIVTYKSENVTHDDMLWVAYVVLPNGNYWGVMFHGATEDEAKNNAITIWNKEQAKRYIEPVKLLSDPWTDAASNAKRADEVSSGRSHHFAGKVWMRHKDTRKLERVALTEVTMYERNGYERSGPRSK